MYEGKEINKQSNKEGRKKERKKERERGNGNFRATRLVFVCKGTFCRRKRGRTKFACFKHSLDQYQQCGYAQLLCPRSQKRKKLLDLTVFFALLGSAHIKAERKHVDEIDPSLLFLFSFFHP